MKGKTMTMQERIAWAKSLKAKANAAAEAAALRRQREGERAEVAQIVAAHTWQGGSGDSLGFLLHLAGVGRGREAHNAPR
jgi:hypothetical protein